jgi:hypothetical protein
VDEDPPNPPFPLFGIHPVISADGNHIAFASWRDYRPGASPGAELSKLHIYVLDRLQNRIVPISFLWKDTNGDDSDGMRDNFEPSNGNCVPVAISADGRIVVFLAQSPLAQSLNIVDADGDGTSDPVNNRPSDWLVLIHDRDADGNGVYDEAGIGATCTSIGNPLDPNGNYIPAASVSVSANGRIIAFATPDPNPANPDENWRVIVRDWQNGDQVEIPNAFAPALSDDGTYLAYLTPQQLDNDGDGQVNEDPVDGVDNDNDGKTDEDPVDFYPQTAMDLVVCQLFDPATGQPLAQIREIRLSGLQLPPQVGTADGSAGWGYSDWWGALALTTAPPRDNDGDGIADEDPINGRDDDSDGKLDEDPPDILVAFHAWATDLVNIQNDLLRDNDGDGRTDEDPINGRDDDNDGRVDEDPPVNFYQGVPNIFLARFDFGSNSVQLWQLLPSSASPTPAWLPRALPVSLERNGTIFRLPLAPSLLPAISFVNPDPNDPRLWRLFVAFQSLVAFDANDTNGLWDIYLADVLLP